MSAVEEAKRLIVQKEVDKARSQGTSEKYIEEIPFEVDYSFKLAKDRHGFVQLPATLNRRPQTLQQLRRAGFEDPILINDYVEKYESVLVECLGPEKLCSITDLGKRVYKEIK